MKKYLHLLLLFAVCCLTACLNTTEELWLNADQSGRYEYHVDMSRMFSFPGLLDKLDKEADSLEQAGKKPIVQMDTVMLLWDVLPDSVASRMSNPDILKRMSCGIKMNKEQKVFKCNFGFDFKQISEIPDFFQALTEFKALKDSIKVGGLPSGQLQMLNNIKGLAQMSFDGKNFERTMPPRQPGTYDAEAEAMLQDKDNPIVKMMFGKAKYRVIVHFPKGIKKLKGEGFEKYGDTVRGEFSMLDVMTSPEKTSFKVKLRK